MAEVFRSAGGMKLTKLIALHADVQDALDKEVQQAHGKATARLAAHRHQGHAQIEVEEGKIDRYLILSDERGMGAALSIEFGRGALEPGQNAMFPNGAPATDGIFALHRAFGLRGS